MTTMTIEQGAELPAQRRTPNEVDLFLYAAAVWLPHRIHYDRRYATEVEGQPDLLVQGPLQAVYLEQAVRGALGRGWRPISYSYRHTAPALVGDELVLTGTIVEVDPDGERLRIEVACTRSDGTATTSGELVFVADERSQGGSGDLARC